MDKVKLENHPTTDAAAKNENERSDQDGFNNTSRIGRRNAMPNILTNNCTTSLGDDLTMKFSVIKTTGEMTLTSFFYLSTEISNFRVVIRSDKWNSKTFEQQVNHDNDTFGETKKVNAE